MTGEEATNTPDTVTLTLTPEEVQALKQAIWAYLRFLKHSTAMRLSPDQSNTACSLDDVLQKLPTISGEL